MRFSILVPLYNAERWLESSLDSIFCQSVQDFELIAVDDGSTDGSGAILDRYSASHPNMKVLRQENQGTYSARFTAVREASGEYCVFCDSDDLLEPDALEKLEKIIAAETPDIILYQVFLLQNGNRAPYGETGFPEGEVTDREQLFRILLTTFDLLPLWKKAFRRDLMDMEMAPEKYPGMNCGEDLLYSVSLFVRARKIWQIRDWLYNYRKDSGMMHRFRDDYYQQYRTVYLAAAPVLEQEPLPGRKAMLGVYLMHAAYGTFHQCAYLDTPEIGSVKPVADDECFREAFYRVRHSEYWKDISRHERLALILIRGKRWRILGFLIRRIKAIKKI